MVINSQSIFLARTFPRPVRVHCSLCSVINVVDSPMVCVCCQVQRSYHRPNLGKTHVSKYWRCIFLRCCVYVLGMSTALIAELHASSDLLPTAMSRNSHSWGQMSCMKVEFFKWSSFFNKMLFNILCISVPQLDFQLCRPTTQCRKSLPAYLPGRPTNLTNASMYTV